MSEKELLYLEDALSHVKFVEEKCTNLASSFSDQNLKNFVQTLASKHKQIYDSLYQLFNR